MLICTAGRTFAQSTAQFYATDAATLRVIALVDKRLALMPEVAAWKWRAQQPISAPAREREVIDRSVADAKAIGLDAAVARDFLALQIQMAVSVEERAFRDWRANRDASIPPARDLHTAIRPQLDRLGVELLRELYLAAPDVSPALKQVDVRRALSRLQRHRGVTTAQLKRLSDVLSRLRLNGRSTLASVRRVGVLRVGTTGDYAPFSYEHDRTLTGFDIQLVAALARHWGVRVEWVRTTWASLLDDLLRNRFDMAVGGITVTPERAARADFSTAYHADGKRAIARCEDARKYSTLAAIDQPQVRVIVNPGGTNERFVRERIKRATIIVHADNRTIFDELLAGRADVMLTDGIEVELQTRRRPKLCGTMQRPLTHAEKAIMLPHRSPLTGAVDAWLAPQIESGKLQKQLEDSL